MLGVQGEKLVLVLVDLEERERDEREEGEEKVWSTVSLRGAGCIIRTKIAK